jgi:1-acyl-sn-glycerol-3-phosphate acyltransferase
MATENQTQKIDVEKLFKEKSPKIGKKIPGFIYRYLRKIVHEDWVNTFLETNGNKIGIDFAIAGTEYFNVTLKTKGEENIPKKGRYIFAANHPLGGFDGLLICQIVEKHFKQYKFLVNDLLYNIPQLRPLFIPINKHGALAVEAARMIDEAYSNDTQILTFPAGLVSRKIKGQIMDLEWQKSFISKAVKYKRDIIPVHVSGSNSKFFYRLSNFRKALGIKANIEMLYLMDETYKHRNKTITITFGKPIPYTMFNTKEKNYKQWAKWVKEQVYAMVGVNKVPV